MAGSTWTSTNGLDGEGDPVFLSPDGRLWSVRRSLGSIRKILERLDAGPPLPWSHMELVGRRDDWVVSVRALHDSGPSWEESLAWIAGRLYRLGEKVLYHDWERGEGFLFRAGLTEARARALAKAIEGRESIDVGVRPILAHLEQVPQEAGGTERA